MKTKYFLFIVVLTLSHSAFSQNNPTDNRPQAYLFSGGGDRSSPPSRPKKAYLLSSGDARPTLTRPRIYKSELVKPVAPASSKTAFNLERRAFELINRQRTLMGLEPLAWSDEAAKIARLHSENMANHNFFSHTGIDGSLVSDRADFFGISKWRAIGENIAYNQGFENPAEFAVERWMKSPKHRDNLLNSRWQESGIGIAVTAGGTYYFTEVFLVRK